MILVLCHGNINRSPACAAVLRGGGVDNVVSAGFVNPGRRAAKKMRDMMLGYHYDLASHRSQLVTRKMMKEATAIVYMDNGNLRRIEEMGVPGIHTISLGSVGGKRRIPDPAYQARDSQEFLETVELIIRCSRKLAKELA